MVSQWPHIIEKTIQTARILSFDIVAGACVCTLFIAKYLKVTLPFACVSALALCIWLVYTVDHLIDAHRTKHQAHSARHYFHQRYFKTITVFFLLVALCGASLLFILPRVVIEWGMVLVLMVGIYFLLLFSLQSRFLFHKEIAAAILYVSGIFLAPFSLSGQPFTPMLIIVFMQFLLIALINLITFSLFEKEQDQADGHISLVRIAGVKMAWRLTIGLNMIVISSALIFIMYLPVSSFSFKIEIIFFGMALTLLVIILKPSIFRKNEIYRMVGDGIFFYPLVLLLF